MQIHERTRHLEAHPRDDLRLDCSQPKHLERHVALHVADLDPEAAQEQRPSAGHKRCDDDKQNGQ